MAFADTIPRTIVDGWGKIPVLLAAAVECGDLLAVSSNTYVLADGDNDRPATMVAGEKGPSGATITAYRGALVRAAFAGASGDLGDILWLSATAGDFALIPFGTTSFCQRVGWVQNANHVVLHPQCPRVVTLALSLGISAGAGAATEINAYSPVIGRIVGAQFINECAAAYASAASVQVMGYGTPAVSSGASLADGEGFHSTTVNQTYAAVIVGSTINWVSGGGAGTQDQWCIVDIGY